MPVKWAPAWWQSKDEDEEKDEKKKDSMLPPELEAKFKAVDETKVAVDKIQEQLKGLDSITAFFDEQKKEKEEARKAAELKKQKENEPADEDLAALLLSDPKKAIADLTSNQTQAILQIRADSIKRQVFEDNASDYEYYSGDIKKEVDSLISSQDLKFQNNPASLANAYHTVVGKRMKEINEGKIKSRFAGSSSSIGGNTTKDKGDFEIETTPDIVRAARLSGMELEDYKKLVKRAAQAGDLEMV